MATFNVEMRQRVSGAFSDIIYPKAHWNNLDGKPATFAPTPHSHGDIGNDGNYVSKTAKHFLGAPNAANGIPSFRALVASDIPTLNQDTTGSAAKLTNARALTIGPTAKNFDGSAAVTWTLAEIGINVVTTCPTAAATAGRVNIYTGAACATKYANWLYFET